MTSTLFRLLKVKYFTRFFSDNKFGEEYIVSGPKPQYKIPNTSLGHLIYEKFSKFQNNQSILIDAITEESITSETIFQHSVSLARSLWNRGFNKNSKLAICSDNNLHFFIPIIASYFIGIPVIFINPMFSCVEKLHCFNMTKPELVFASKLSFPELDILKIKFHMDYIKKIVIIDSSDLKKFTTENPTRTKTENFSGVAKADEDVALILFTAGTTQLPKGVELTHQNIITELINFKDDRFFAQTGDTPHLGILPFCYGYGLIASLFDLIMGHQSILLKSCKVRSIFETVDNYKIKRIWVGSLLFKILARDTKVGKFDLSCLKELNSSGSFLGSCIENKLKKKFTSAKIRQSFNLTETTANVLVNNYHKPLCGSCGKVVPHMLCKVIDLETKESLQPFRVGEFCFKGPMVMKGYYKSGTPVKDGWFYSGDVGYYDNDQNFYHISRISDIITYENKLLSPSIIEDVLLSHSEIEDAGVVARPTKDNNFLPFAFIVKKVSSTLCKIDVQDYIKGKLSECMWLRGGVVFITKIPRNNFGKIRRHELRRFLKLIKTSP